MEDGVDWMVMLRVAVVWGAWTGLSGCSEDGNEHLRAVQLQLAKMGFASCSQFVVFVSGQLTACGQLVVSVSGQLTVCSQLVVSVSGQLTVCGELAVSVSGQLTVCGQLTVSVSGQLTVCSQLTVSVSGQLTVCFCQPFCCNSTTLKTGAGESIWRYEG